MRHFLLATSPLVRRRILVFLVACVPVIFWRPLNDPFNVPKLSLLFAGTAVVAVLRAAEILQGADRSGLRRVWLPAAAVAAPVFISWIFSPYKGWALMGDHGRFQGLIPYLAMSLLAVLLADAFAGRAEELAWAFVAGAAIAGGYAIAQAVGVDPFRWVLDDRLSSRALSTLGNPNFTGGILGIATPVGVGLWFYDPRRRALSGVAIALILGGSIAAKSYGGWAAGLAGLCVCAGIWLTPRWGKAKLLGALAAGGLALLVAGSVIFTIVEPRNDLAPSSFKQRGDAWVAAGKMFSESPLVGRGPNSFALEGIRHRPIRDALKFGFTFADDPHSVPLSWLANAGLPGVVGFLVLAWWILRSGYRQEDVTYLTAAFFGGAVAYLIQALVSIDELSLRLALWTCLAGMVTSTVSAPKAAVNRTTIKATGKRVRKRPEPAAAWPILVLLGGIAAAVVWWSGAFVVADEHVLTGRVLFDQREPEAAHAEMLAAFSFYDDPEYRKEHILGLGKAALREASVDPLDANKYIRAARESFTHLEVPDVFTIAGWGRILHAWGNYFAAADSEALSLFQRAVKLDPVNPYNRIGAADILVDLGRANEASEVLEPLIPLVRDPEKDFDSLSDFWGALAVARAEMGDRPGAMEAIRLSLSIDPDDQRAQRAEEILAGG